MVITSVNNNKIKEINKLKEKKYRDSSNSFLVEGEHLVIEAYRENLIKELIVLDDSNFILDGIPTIKVSSEVMKKLSSMDSYPSVIGVANKIKEKELGDSILMLDDIQDPGNLGTIIRSSAAFGIDTIVVSPKTVDIYNIKVLRATQGMLFHINIIVRELDSFITKLKQDNYKIYGTKVDKGVNIKNISINNKYALVMGNEGKGISDNVSKLCDEYLYIKMNDNVESLNVGVATSILLYEIYNK